MRLTTAEESPIEEELSESILIWSVSINSYKAVNGNDDTFGICRFCGRRVKLLKNKKHLRTHYVRSTEFYTYKRVRCFGSRKLDYKNKYLIKISEKFEEI